jgi:hypothetical protein
MPWWTAGVTLPQPEHKEREKSPKHMRHGKDHEKQQIIRLYREKTGVTEVNMHEVAKFAIQMGCAIPPPVDPIDRLAKELSRAARAEYAYDEKTKRPYRVNHALLRATNGVQTMFWVHIEHARRSQMLASLTLRREQMVSDGAQLTFDADHWNAMHPNEDPIQMQLDLTLDVEWRKNAPDDEQEAS